MGTKTHETHAEWHAWFEASAYTPEIARKELGLANGTFYRRIKSAPDAVTRLAMAALYEGIEPWRSDDVDPAEEVARQSMERAHGVIGS
jgi:hypothetical protein